MSSPTPPSKSGSRYRTIVADPPWDVRRPVGGYGGDRDRNRDRRAEEGSVHIPLDYPTMTTDEIAALPVRGLSMPDTRPERLGSHLYLWTTTAHIDAAFHVSRAWGFEPSCILVWCKPHGGFVGGTFFSNVEFVVFGRRGAPAAREAVPTRWFQWPRGKHSEKPEAFLDMVERVSHGPYLEMFARRARFGWDYWGNQSLGTAKVEDAA